MAGEIPHFYKITQVFKQHFQPLPSMEKNINWIEQYPKSWQIRLDEFDRIVDTMNTMLEYPESCSPDYHPDIDGLRKTIEILPTLSELATIEPHQPLKQGEKEISCDLINHAFSVVREQMHEGGAWEWVNNINDNFQALTGLLVEGYGLLLSQLYHSDLKRPFVKAFKEVLWTENKTLESEGKRFKTLDDLILWMVEQKADFPEKIANEITGETRYGRKFGDSKVLDDDPTMSGESPGKQLRVLAWSQACPVPDKVGEAYGTDWAIKRYTECNFWTSYIVEKVNKLNPALGDELKKTYIRPENESPKNINELYVPESYKKEISFMSTPWGYALARILIEQFGRGEEQTAERMKKGLRIVNKVVKKSKTPAELVARLAGAVVQADARPETVLGHVFALEFINEGQMFLTGSVVEELKKRAAELWEKYQSIGSSVYHNYRETKKPTIEYIKHGIIPPSKLT